MNASTSVVSSSVASQSSSRAGLLAMCVLLAPWLAAWLLPPVAQPQSFHDYADQRVWLGLPHAADVLSNLPFLAVGACGLHFALRGWHTMNRSAFADRHAAAPYAVLFAGVALTAFGSAWYHAQPNDATLLWDRLPMALGFAGLAAGTLTDRAPQRLMQLLLAFVAVGAGTVLYWHASANLLPYLLMQAGFIAAALIATAWIKPRYTHSNRVYAATGLYAVAVIFERLDHQVYALLNGWISGHTMKHLFACAAILIILSMLRAREFSAQ
ncbi:MAG TPA: hypothetical protein VNA44_04180 [Burkholderiaceae bacterium]|nr:hypothetical protein [Burkholderiaceae bacterium]